LKSSKKLFTYESSDKCKIKNEELTLLMSFAPKVPFFPYFRCRFKTLGVKGTFSAKPV
jgi:hypothetical protein